MFYVLIFVYAIGSDTNCRVPPKSISTSILSKSGPDYFETKFTSNFDIESIQFRLHERRPELCYSLSDIYKDLRMRILKRDQNTAGKALITKILDSDKQLEVLLTKDHEVPLFKDIDIPNISSRVKPDISVYNKSKKVYVMFIEVESESLESTIRKMYFVLLLHLVKVRISNKSISTVTGVVLPKINNNSGCVAVTVAWDIPSFRFVGTLSPIIRSDIPAYVRERITEQDTLTSKLVFPTTQKYYFQDCLSAADVEEYFKHKDPSVSIKSIHFFPTKYAFAFADNEGRKVYKYPLINNNLSDFLWNPSIAGHRNQIVQVLFPSGCFWNFFVFPLLHPPLDILTIQQCFTSFAFSTMNALDELHRIGFAHLDVRTPNICFKQVDHDWHAVLIDLDTAIYRKGSVPPCTKDSLMYDILFEDDYHKYDWRQFALLLSRVIDGTDRDYHTRKPVFRSSQEHKELEKSFTSGSRPPEWSLKINLVDSPKLLKDLLPLPQ